MGIFNRRYLYRLSLNITHSAMVQICDIIEQIVQQCYNWSSKFCQMQLPSYMIMSQALGNQSRFPTIAIICSHNCNLWLPTGFPQAKSMGRLAVSHGHVRSLLKNPCSPYLMMATGLLQLSLLSCATWHQVLQSHQLAMEILVSITIVNWRLFVIEKAKLFTHHLKYSIAI